MKVGLGMRESAVPMSNDGAAVRPVAFGRVVVGFTLLYAVCVMFFYSAWLYGVPGNAVSVFDAVLNPAITAAGVVLACMAARRPASGHRPLFAAGCACLAVALAGIAACSLLQMEPLVPVTAAFAGVGMGLAMPFCFRALAGFGRARVALGCAVMAAAGMVLAMGIELLGVPAAAAACLVMLVVGAGLLLSSRASAPIPAAPAAEPNAPAAPARRELVDIFLVPAACTFALSVVYGIIDAVALGAAPSPTISIYVSQCGGIAAAIVFYLCFGRPRQVSSAALFNTVFGILATGILALPFASAAYAMALNALVAAGWKLVMLALFYLVVVTYAAHPARLLAAIALAYALPRCGLFVGVSVAGLVGVGSGADFVLTAGIAFACLYLILMVIWAVNARERKRAEAAAREAARQVGSLRREADGARRARCDEVARAHDLTAREADVLYLLAQGRDTDSIAEACSLAKNTVKSYRKAIYAKLGVHSRQEVIDLVAPRE